MAVVAGLLTACAGSFGAEAPSADSSSARIVLGPLIQTFPLTLEPGRGLEAVGPFYFRKETEDGVYWGIPPFVSSFRSFDGDQSHAFVLPPIFNYHRYGEEWKWEIGQLISGSSLDKIDKGEVRRFTLFPLFFYQDAAGEDLDYWAILPIYGRVKGRLFRDESEFLLFPLWLKTRKGTMTTRNVLFPFVHFRDGPGLKGWQFFPLGGHEHLEPTTRTNLVDEVVVVPGHDKMFGLWPVWFRNRLGLGTDNPARVDAIMPFYYKERSPERDHTSVAWPLVSWTDNRKEGFHQWNAPWPLISFARGEGKTLDRVAPLFSVGHSKSYEAQSYLWPLYRRHHLHTETIDRDRWQLALFLYSDLREKNLETHKGTRRIDSWPLWTWSRNVDGMERLQVPALFEPLRRGTGMERNWSPLWSIWRAERNTQTGAESQSLLWNLYRRDSRPAVTNGSLLFGAVQYERTSAGRRWRWLHLGPPLADHGKPAAPNNVSEPR